MKYIFFTLLMFTIPFITTAQEDERLPSAFVVHMGADYQLNKGDVTNNTADKNVLTAANTIGGRIGAEYHWIIAKSLFIAVGTDVRITPQKLVLNYHANRMGHSNTNVSYTEEFSFTNYYIEPNFRMGYSFALPKKDNSIDFSFGLVINIPVSGKKDEEVVALNITDNEYTDIAMYRNSAWGYDMLEHKRGTGIAITPYFATQLAYNTSIAGRKFTLGINYTAAPNQRVNRTEINYFGPNRTDAGNSVFTDKFQSVGLVIGVVM